MTKVQKITIIASVALCLLLVGGALMLSRQKPARPAPQVLPQRPVSMAELTRSDGKDGRDCLVAVDGTVYKIQDFTLWQDGQHKSSKGQAYCGADMSKIMAKAPHGKSKLDVLIKVGPLTKKE